MKNLLVAALSLLALAAPARAQDSTAPPALAAVAGGDAEWSLRVGPRLIDALGSPSADVRARALHAVGDLVAISPGGVDLRPAVPALLHVLRTDPDWRHRVMALRSLGAAGDEGAMAALRGEAGRQSHPPVQRLLLWTLVDHYGQHAFRGDSDMASLAQAVLDHDRPSNRARGTRGRLVAAR